MARPGFEPTTSRHSHTHVHSRAEDLTLNVRAYVLGWEYKSALYTVHTYTHLQSKFEDLTLNVRACAAVHRIHTHTRLSQLQSSYAVMQQLLLYIFSLHQGNKQMSDKWVQDQQCRPRSDLVLIVCSSVRFFLEAHTQWQHIYGLKILEVYY